MIIIKYFYLLLFSLLLPNYVVLLPKPQTVVTNSNGVNPIGIVNSPIVNGVNNLAAGQEVVYNSLGQPVVVNTGTNGILNTAANSPAALAANGLAQAPGFVTNSNGITVASAPQAGRNFIHL